MKSTRLISLSLYSSLLVLALGHVSVARAEEASAPAVDPAASGETAELPRFYIGGLGGLALPMGGNTSNTSARLGYGGHLGVRIWDGITLGAFFLGSNGNASSSTSRFNTAMGGGEANYFWQATPEFVVQEGFRGGVNNLSVGSSRLGTSVRSAALGPVAGAHYFLGKRVSVGAEASLIFVLSAEASSGALNVASETFQMFNLSATIKLWLF